MSDTHPSIATDHPDAGQTGNRDAARRADPMTPEQRRELMYLSEKAQEPDAYQEDLTRLEAENRLKLLHKKLHG